MTGPSHDERNRQERCRSTRYARSTRELYGQLGTDKNPAETDKNSTSLHACRDAEKMAQRQPTWRLSGAEAVYVALATDHSLTAAGLNTRSEGYVRFSLPAISRIVEPDTDDLVAILASGDRHDTFQP